MKLSASLLVTCVCLAAIGVSIGAGAPERPNILWIISEDIGPDLGCYGDFDASTPNLDRFAAEGRLYRKAYSTAPVCSASRSAFCTGMYQTSFGANHHRSHRDDGFTLPEGVRLITDRLREAGYFTANASLLPPELGFTAANKSDWNFTLPAGKKPFDTARWTELKKHQPFYAQVNLHETHRPYKRSNENPTDPAKVKLPPYLADHPIAREDWALYHDAIHDMDAKAGAVLNLLERDGLKENTIVVFMGDHGRECFRGKYFSYEQGCHTSLIVRWPGKVPAGEKSDDLISLIDLAATTLSLAGVKLPAGFHGQPFLGPEARRRDLVFTARDRIDDTLDRVRTVRDAQFKYIRNFQPERPYIQPMAYAEMTNPNFNLMKQLLAEGKLNADQAKFMAASRPAEELYDLKNDPWEFHNLAGQPEHAAALKRLRESLDAWIKDTHDQGETPEDPAALQRILDDHRQKMEEQASKKKPK